MSTTPSGPGDFLSNGGLYQTVANSVAGSITSHLTASLTNELRLQWATEDKPRRMNPAGQFGAPVPQVVINNIGSDGRSNTTDVIFGSDPALHANRLGTRTYHYRVNTNFGRAAPTQFTLNQQCQVQLGIRYDF